MTDPDSQVTLTSYDVLAAEYYDSVRHPTCANFREASQSLIEQLVPFVATADCCEVGAGDSILARLIARRHGSLARVLITDASPEMLCHSRKWQRHGAGLAIARASHLPLRDRSQCLVVASLGDPYDDDGFWHEVSRVLVPGGHCVLTTPSWEWGERFRKHHQPCTAQFTLADGRMVGVPSCLRPPRAEYALIGRHGLSVVAEGAVAVEHISSPLSPKLDIMAIGEPVVRGFLARSETA